MNDDDHDKKRFAKAMIGLAEDCSAQISKAGLSMRFEALKQYTIEQIEQAIINVMKSNIYTKMPTTGTIINAIEGTPEDRSESQLVEIRKEISRIGSYGTPKFSDIITSELVSFRFGWNHICSMSNKEFEHFSRDFKSAYLSHGKTLDSKAIQLKSSDLKKLISGIGDIYKNGK